jgi:hypothetical protein
MRRSRHEESDEFEVSAVGEGYQRVVSAESRMAAAANHRETQRVETGDRAIQIVHDDHDVINSLEHRIPIDTRSALIGRASKIDRAARLIGALRGLEGDFSGNHVGGDGWRGRRSDSRAMWIELEGDCFNRLSALSDPP